MPGADPVWHLPLVPDCTPYREWHASSSYGMLDGILFSLFDPRAGGGTAAVSPLYLYCTVLCADPIEPGPFRLLQHPSHLTESTEH
jgi:hypothetical protein